jgi:AcrR family transcriptional regulator
MSVSENYDPRGNQKQRTRAAIVDAAIQLLRAGRRPSVAEAAAAAKVSRATAYRYFLTQEALLAEAAVMGPVESVEQMLEDQTGEPRARLLDLQAAFNAIVVREESAMRMALRTYLDAWFAARERGEDMPDIREGRRTRWIATALAPLLDGLPESERRRLAAALALTMGVEPLLVMKDVCGLGDEEARSVLRWVAQTLVGAASQNNETGILT